MAVIAPNPVNVDINMTKFQCLPGYQGPSARIQGRHNIAKTGDIEAVIHKIDHTPNAGLQDKLCAYFDCLSQLKNMQHHLYTDRCISVLKSKIYSIAKTKTHRADVLQSITASRVVENPTLQDTIRKVRYLTKAPFCQTKKKCCYYSLRGTRFSHHLSKIYGNLSRPEMSSGLALFSTTATGLMGAGLSAMFASSDPNRLAVAIPLLGFAGAITVWTIINAVSDAFGEEP